MFLVLVAFLIVPWHCHHHDVNIPLNKRLTIHFSRMMKTVYVSITGLRLHAFYNFPQFAYHAVPSMTQAKSAPGNISAEGSVVDGVHHTLSVWEDRKSMLQYMRSGAHIQAMKVFDDIATGKVYGYETDVVPTWDEAIDLWNTKGRVVGKAAREKKRDEEPQDSTVVNA